MTAEINIKSNESIQNVAITDSQGREIANQEVNDNVAAIDVSSYSKGIYFLKITTAAGTSTKKIIKE